MRCEVVAIGTELLLGVIIDSNSSWIGEQLALAGIDSHFQTKVGDNPARMEACIRQALERSDAVICCGGLGPTQDDLTRDVIARVMGVEVRRDEEIAVKIRKMFESRGRTMSANNLRQADIPVGAAPIAQMPGTAPGLVCPVGDKVIYAVPGVPREMKEMVTGTVLPDLRRRSGQSAVIRSRTVRTWGLSESGIDEMLTARMAELDKLGNPTIAFNASGIEGIKVRVTAKCDDEATAFTLLDAEEKIIRAVLGNAVFGLDDQAMEDVVLGMLKARGLTLSAHETITGGILSARMSARDVPMATFKGATVAGDVGAGDLGAAGGPPEQRGKTRASRARNLQDRRRVGRHRASARGRLCRRHGFSGDRHARQERRGKSAAVFRPSPSA
jgi:nicotinamide-nucleotide amidase